MTSEYSIPVREIPIATLGQAKIPSPLPYGNMINTGKVMLSLSHEYDEDIDTHQTLLFEEAGPRQDLYFDPGKTKCAIVTCGGLCPGLNDVIRAIVLEAYHAYNTPSVLGIRYGLEGFIPSYSHNVMELTPASVEHIYQFGGTLLGSSRGPQEPSEIVDALERLNVSVLFVIGGDGSMKAASAIAKEVRQRNIRISIIGIPKTIDNDINFVPQSFGFDTAVDKAPKPSAARMWKPWARPTASASSSSWAASPDSSRRSPPSLCVRPTSCSSPKRRSSCTATAACSPRWNGASNCAGTPSSSRLKAQASTSSSRTRPATPPGIPCCPTWGAC